MLNNFQPVLMKAFFDAGLRDISKIAGYSEGALNSIGDAQNSNVLIHSFSVYGKHCSEFSCQGFWSTRNQTLSMRQPYFYNMPVTAAVMIPALPHSDYFLACFKVILMSPKHLQNIGKAWLLRMTPSNSGANLYLKSAILTSASIWQFAVATGT